MRSERSGDGASALPPDLVPDHALFERALRATFDSTPTFGRSLDETVALLVAYGRLLHDRASRLALIAKGDRSQLFTRHILDSLNPVSLFVAPPASLLDVGSGGGLPGIPLAIAWPKARVVLLESREKKAGFLEHAVRDLRLERVQVACERVEQYGTRRPVAVEVVMVRALAGLPDLLESVAGAVDATGRWVYFLGSREAREALPESAGRAARVETGLFGGRLLVGRFDRASAGNE